MQYTENIYIQTTQYPTLSLMSTLPSPGRNLFTALPGTVLTAGYNTILPVATPSIGVPNNFDFPNTSKSSQKKHEPLLIRTHRQ